MVGSGRLPAGCPRPVSTPPAVPCRGLSAVHVVPRCHAAVSVCFTGGPPWRGVRRVGVRVAARAARGPPSVVPRWLVVPDGPRALAPQALCGLCVGGMGGHTVVRWGATGDVCAESVASVGRSVLAGHRGASSPRVWRQRRSADSFNVVYVGHPWAQGGRSVGRLWCVRVAPSGGVRVVR